MVRHYSKSQLESIVGRNEQVLWRAKPNKLCYVLESIFNPLLPFALLWFVFDSFFIFAYTVSNNQDPMGNFIIPFMLIHLMPVWIYIGGVLTTFLRYKNTEYLITDKRIYTSGGTFSFSEYSVEYSDIKNVRTHIGFFDKFLALGDVIISSDVVPSGAPRIVVNGRVKEFSGYNICDIPDFRNVYEIIREKVDSVKQEIRMQAPQEEIVEEETSSYLNLYRKRKDK